MILPATGATASMTSRGGSIAAPKPTMPWEKIGSGTSVRATARPRTGARMDVVLMLGLLRRGDGLPRVSDHPGGRGRRFTTRTRAGSPVDDRAVADPG